MILSIMLYMLLTAFLVGGAAVLAERLCAHGGLARRGVWIAALAASVMLPGYAMLADRAGPEARRQQAPPASVSPSLPSRSNDLGGTAGETRDAPHCPTSAGGRASSTGEPPPSARRGAG